MAKSTIKKMLGNLPVGVVDVVRLFVECCEVGELSCGTKAELVAGFRRIVQAGVKAVADEEKTVGFGEAVERCLEMRKVARRSTQADWRSYAGRMVRYGDWAGKPLRGIGPEECRGLLQGLFGHSAWAFRKGRSVLHAIFAFGVRQGWCERNPVDAIETPQVVEQRIEALGMEEVRRLMSACKGTDMEPAVRVMLWCGVRPGEVQRLTWGEVDAAERVLYVPPQHSKTGGARLIPLRGRAQGLARGGVGPIAPRNWAKKWRDLRHRAGLSQWRPDTLRHTFASMHLRRFANPPMLQAEMGHGSCALLRTRYVNLRGLSAAAAERFWR